MKKFLYNFCPIAFMLFLILFSLFTVANSENFYMKQYVKNETSNYTGMSVTDLIRASNLLLDYMQGDVETLDMQVEKHGVMKELFDEREKAHMIDVKNLYVFFERAMYILFIVSVGGFAYLYFNDKWNFTENLLKGFKFSLIFAVILTVFFASAFTLGFDTFWTLFHHVMFTNDLWLLDPKISTMINMFPLRFFLAMCTSILLRFVGLFALSFAGVTVMNKKFSKG